MARFNDEINVYIVHQLQSVLSLRKCDLFSKDVMPLFSYKVDYNKWSYKVEVQLVQW